MAVVPTIVDILEGWGRKCGNNNYFNNYPGAVITATGNTKAPRLGSYNCTRNFTGHSSGGIITVPRVF